jgi:trans-2-enoyl-CoA reductase
MVGLAVIQIAKQMGVKTVNIVRSDLPESDKALRLLTNLGGDVNITDSFVNTQSFREILGDLPPCKLAINCIGGEVTQDLVRSIAPGGTLVTVGGMSKQPAVVPFELVASKQLKLRGFWLDGWYQRHTASEKAELLSEIAQMVREKKLTFFYEVHDFDDFDHALQRALAPEVAVGFRKVLLNIDHPDRLMEHDAKDDKEYQIFETSVV